MHKLLQEMMQQMTNLQEKVDAIQNLQIEPRQDSDKEAEEGTGGVVQLTEMIITFLEAAFSGIMTNADRKSK